MLHKLAPIDFHCKCIIVALIFAYFYVQIEESKLFIVLLNIVTYAADRAKLEVNPICSCNIKIDSAVDSCALTKSVGFPPEGSAWKVLLYWSRPGLINDTHLWTAAHNHRLQTETPA